MPFESSMLRSLDLAQAASQQYGPDATVVSDSEHLYDWRARVKVQTNPDAYLDMPLDVSQAARSEYGAASVGEGTRLRAAEQSYRRGRRALPARSRVRSISDARTRHRRSLMSSATPSGSATPATPIAGLTRVQTAISRSWTRPSRRTRFCCPM